MLRGIEKVTAQIATDGKYFLHFEQEGGGSGKAVAVPQAVLQKLGTRGATPSPSPGTACRTVSHQEHSASQGYWSHLPGWQEPFSLCQVSVGMGRLAVATHPQPGCCQPSRGTGSKCLEEQRVAAGAEAESGGARPKHCQGMSCDVISAEGKGRCVGPALEIPSLP